jgi:hypothetical protein
MALAILQPCDSDGTNKRFKADIGNNRFYTYSIGRGKWRDTDGLEKLDNATFTSPLLGPISETTLGRTVLSIPSHYFDRHNRWVQLTSYRTPDRVGPAISDVLEVVPTLADYPSSKIAFPLSQDSTMSPPLTPEPTKLTPPDSVPFQYVEAQSYYSEGMFLGSIVKAISGVASKLLPMAKKALPMVQKAVGSLAGGGSVSAGKVTASSGGVSSLVGSLLGGTTHPNGAAAGGITSLLEGLLGSTTHPTGSHPETAQTNASEQATLAKLLSNPDTLHRLSQLLQQKATATSGQPSSTKQALAALLQQAAKVAPKAAQEENEATNESEDEPAEALSLEELSEQQGVFDFFKDMAGKIAGGLKDVGNFVLNNAPAIIDFIASNPELLAVALSDEVQVVAAPQTQPAQALHQVTTQHITGLASPTSVPDYHRVNAVQLQFTGLTPQQLHGRTVTLYRQERDILFPLSLQSPRRITNGTLYLLVTHATTLKVVLEQTYPLEHLTTGTLPVVPRLSRNQLQTLEPNAEYLVSVALVWTARSPQTGETRQLGTNQTERITLMGEYCFDRIEETLQTTPLNDVEKYRPYWHKVWQGDFKDALKHITWDCKYYYALEPNRDNNARMETVTTIDEEDATHRTGRLKTGMILSPLQINALLHILSSHPPLDEGELKALISPEFKDRFSCVAQTQVQFDGKQGDSVAVWVYPEVKLQPVVLQKAEQTDENGQVTKLSEQSIVVPMPAIAHFIGTSSNTP